MTDVAANLAALRARIADAANASGRAADDITLVTVTKTVELDAIRAALAAGALDVGENRAQEMREKAEALRGVEPAPRWHFIGRLQRNKVKMVAPFVALWQSVDRDDLVDEIARHAPNAAVLVQVNVAGEAQKGGCAPEQTAGLVARARDRGLRVEGLMTVPPAGDDPTPWFSQLRRECDEMGFSTCSMGMSNDFEAAIAAGSTMVRIGSAVFGPRPPGSGARR